MRGFRFRLDPVVRLKEYQIERKEEEIAEIDREIQQRLDEIEVGRQQVQAMRNRILDEVDDENFLQAELSIDQFRQYMHRVEMQKRKEITEFEEKKKQKQKELIKLYQEEKMLERYKEKKKQDWMKENQRLESYQMDEIGMQNFLRKNEKRGGVLMYLLVPIVLLGAVAAIGWYTGAIKKEMLQNIPYIGDRFKSATDTITIQSATEEDFTYTFEDLIGETPSTTMKRALQNLANEREKMRTLELSLRDKERQLNEREQLIDRREQQLSDLVKFATEQITVLRDLDRQQQERQQSQLSERELTFSNTLSKIQSKNAAPMMIEMYNQPAATPPQLTGNETPEEIDAIKKAQKEARDKQLMVLRLLHRYQAKGLEELFTAISKNDPQTGAQIIADYLDTPDDELYNFKPRTVDEIMKDLEKQKANETTPDGGQNPLPPPEEQNIQNPMLRSSLGQ